MYAEELKRIDYLKRIWKLEGSRAQTDLSEAQSWKLLAFAAAGGDAVAYLQLLHCRLSEVFELYCLRWHATLR